MNDKPPRQVLSLPRGVPSEATTEWKRYAVPPAPTGIPVVYYDVSPEKRNANGKLVKA